MKRWMTFLLIAALALCFTCEVKASYEPPLDKVLIYVDLEGGLRAPILDMAKVPIFLLYSDGELLYSFDDEREGVTKLMRAHLDEKEIDHLRKIIREKGSGEWNEYYENCPLTDVPSTRMYINFENEAKTINVLGMDYAVKNRTIPQGLIDIYRKLSWYSSPDAKEYEPEKIILYVRKITPDPGRKGARVYKWRQKLDLAPLAEETTLSGFGSILLEDKNARSVYKEVRDKVPFSTPDTQAYFKQGRNFYSLAYRPLLLHEIEKKEEKGKKK